MWWLLRRLHICFFLLLLNGCGSGERENGRVQGRWYTEQQVESGQVLYSVHCAACHGSEAQGLVADWRTRDANGNYPPPPLNGTAHAWHHPLSVLERTIMEGGLAIGGVMPGFAGMLTEQEARSTVAYFQSLWIDEIYRSWEQIDAQ